MPRIIRVTEDPSDDGWLILGFAESSHSKFIQGSREVLVAMLVASGTVRLRGESLEAIEYAHLTIDRLYDDARKALDAYDESAGKDLAAIRDSIDGEEFSPYEIAWMDYELRELLADESQSVKDAWVYSPIAERTHDLLVKRVIAEMRKRKGS